MQFSRFSGVCQVHCSEKMRPFPYIQEDGKGQQIGVISTLMEKLQIVAKAVVWHGTRWYNKMRGAT